MIQIPFVATTIAFSFCWLFVRSLVWRNKRRICWKREAHLLLVYICLMVALRITFFPFSKVNDMVQPLLFDAAQLFPPRLNFQPLIHLMDYESLSDAMLNLMGNIGLFIPMGIVWPSVFKELNSHPKVIAAGVGLSLCIEILQLPFFDRVTDIDDLLLNSLGYLFGYGIYLLLNRRKTVK